MSYRNSFVDRVKRGLSTGKKSIEKHNIILGSEIKPKKLNKIETIQVTMTKRQMAYFRIIGGVVVYFSYLLFNSLHLLYLILAGFLISVAMEVFVSRGEKWIPRGLSITIMYLILLFFVLAGFIIIFPFLLEQISSVIDFGISQIQNIGQQIGHIGIVAYINDISRAPGFVKEYFLGIVSSNANEFQSAITNNISSLVSLGSSYATSIGGLALSLVGSFLSVIFQTTIVFVVAIFFTADKDKVVDFFVHHVSSNASTSQILGGKINLFYKKMGRWLKMQLFLCLYIFGIVYIALLILSLFGMPLSNIFSLALMAGFTELLPYIGPVLGAIPAIIVASILYGWKGFIIVTLIYIVIQQTESNILIPLLMKKSLGVSALLILLCALFFGSVLGFIGVLLAVPFAILLTMLFKRDFE